MTDLEISQTAVRACYASPYAESTATIRSILELGAPHIVAAELRRLAESLQNPADGSTASWLIQRAYELDSGAA